MRYSSVSSGLRVALAVFTVALFATSTWAQEKVLYSFNPEVQDGYEPNAGLIADGAGNRYGTTSSGGIHSYGTVFELSPKEGGGYTERVLHSFGLGTDGRSPIAGLVLDGAGNLYGTTEYGGIHSCPGGGCGTVFELSPREGGGWTETVLHSFGNGTDGIFPQAGLVSDAVGNLYGTTESGGIHSVGAVFELIPRQGGGYTETVLHSFGNGNDGFFPEAGLVRDANGNLYGTTYEGGIHVLGTVFELSPRQGGGYTETVLHSFGNGTDGYYPYYGSLVIDGGGNLYGTTQQGGIHGLGTAFELSPREGGSYSETLLHSFGNPATQDGSEPEAGFIFDTAGNLYSTTLYGGIHNSGTVFELSPNGSGGWTEMVLRSFDGTDGGNPQAGLILDGAGNLYGTTYYDGIYFVGTAFELSPNGSGGWAETVLHSFDPRGTDGALPYAALLFDSAGNLYGTTTESGTNGDGTVFELSPAEGGNWTETTLANFNGPDGATPLTGNLVFDSAGNLYGTTNDGGTYYGHGTVFELTPNGGGGWTDDVLHNFANGSDGNSPYAGVIFDTHGNLYGTNIYGGTNSWGTVYELSPNGSGGWTEVILHDFNNNGTDGIYSLGSLIFDSAGNLYGTTLEGGANGAGIVYELSPNGSGGWTETVLYNFCSQLYCTDGYFPFAGLVFDAHGNLYGTTGLGGPNYEGGRCSSCRPTGVEAGRRMCCTASACRLAAPTGLPPRRD